MCIVNVNVYQCLCEYISLLASILVNKSFSPFYALSFSGVLDETSSTSSLLDKCRLFMSLFLHKENGNLFFSLFELICSWDFEMSHGKEWRWRHRAPRCDSRERDADLFCWTIKAVFLEYWYDLSDFDSVFLLLLRCVIRKRV